MTNKEIEKKLILEVNDITPNILDNILKQDIKKEEKVKLFNFSYLKLASLVTVFLLLVVSSFIVYSSEVEKVAIDINPSIEFEVNTFGRVTDVEYNNDDAYNLFSELKLKNKKIEDVIKLCYQELYENGYFNDEETILVISGYSKKQEKEEERLEKYNKIIEEECKKTSVVCNILKNLVDQEMIKKSEEFDLSFGKLKVIDEIMISNSDFSFEELKDLNMKLLKDLLTESNKSFEDYEEQIKKLEEEFASIKLLEQEILDLTNKLLNANQETMKEIIDMIVEKKKEFNERYQEYEKKKNELEKNNRK